MYTLFLSFSPWERAGNRLKPLQISACLSVKAVVESVEGGCASQAIFFNKSQAQQAQVQITASCLLKLSY